MTLPCETRSAAVARRAVSAQTGAEDVGEDARLVASELVANAVRHAGCLPGDGIDLVLRRSGVLLEIEVCDPGRSGQVPGIVADAGPGWHLGLRMVERVARRWGVRHDGTCLVWAELALER
jgi:anti-sigma regulatory factor (Ser/Thr protein kinase)